MSRYAIIDAYRGRLTRAEDAILSVALSRENPDMTAEALAKIAGTHPSTVVRLTQKLGFRGYPEMRDYLKSESVSNFSGPTRTATWARHVRTVDDFVQNEIHELERFRTGNLQPRIDKAAQLIDAAKLINVHSTPYLIPQADFLTSRFRRIGKHAQRTASDGRLLAQALVNTGPGDVLISFTAKSVPPSLARILAYVQGRGTKTIVITDAIEIDHEGGIDILIRLPVPEDRFFRTGTNFMYCAYVLYYATYFLAPEASAKYLDEFDLLARLSGDNEPTRIGRTTPTVTKGGT